MIVIMSSLVRVPAAVRSPPGSPKRDLHDSAAGLREAYLVPGFHPLASENPAMSWNFFVCHFADDERQKADPKC
jgi:hypothetical protein